MKLVGLVGSMSWERSARAAISLSQDDCAVPLFDTITLHAKAAVDAAIAEMS